MYKLNYFPVNLSCVNSIIRPAKRTQEGLRGQISPSPHYQVLIFAASAINHLTTNSDIETYEKNVSAITVEDRNWHFKPFKQTPNFQSDR